MISHFTKLHLYRMCCLVPLCTIFGISMSGKIAFASEPIELTVNTTADAMDFKPGDGICETEEGNQTCTLRAAIMEANQYTGDDKITVPEGVYDLSRSGRDEDATLSGDFDVTESLTIVGAGQSSTIVDAHGLDRVFDVITGTLKLSTMTIQNGDAGNVQWGGTIRAVNTNLDVTNVTIQNGTGGNGGAIAFYNGRSTIRNSILEANEATGWAGGAIYAAGSKLEIKDTKILENLANAPVWWPAGGAIYIEPTSDVLIQHTLIARNHTTVNGGGIYNNGTLTIFDSAIIANIAGNAAGALIVDNDGTAVISNTTVADNRTTGVSNILLDEGAWIKIWNSTIAGNRADQGGGITNGVQVGNSIIALNTDTNGNPSDCAGTPLSMGNNLIGTTSNCTLSGDLNGSVLGGKPQLSALKQTNDSLPAFELLPGSPAIDTANPANCPDHDQNGLPRPMDGNDDAKFTCDMGAVEKVGPRENQVYIPFVILTR